MSESAGHAAQTISNDELRAALEGSLSKHFNRLCRIAELKRCPSEYSSSFAMEELDVRLDNGTALQIMFKNLSWEAMLEGARQAKPAFLYDPLREIGTYHSILKPNLLNTPIFYGAFIDHQRALYWLFIEKVMESRKLRHVGEFEIWQQVAYELAVMHTRLSKKSQSLSLPQAHLLRYDGDLFRAWMRRAQALWQHVGQSQPADMPQKSIDWLAARYDQVVEQLLQLPTTFIHGDFFAGNVLVQETAKGRLVRPVDWEMSGIGPGLIDLAALTSGSWTEEQNTDLAMTYYAALSPANGWPPSRDAFLTALDCCHLHLAIQWLGWSTDWSPPFDEAQDWLGVALRLTEKLDL